MIILPYGYETNHVSKFNSIMSSSSIPVLHQQKYISWFAVLMQCCMPTNVTDHFYDDCLIGKATKL